MIIHYCNWSDQPDIGYMCGRFTSPAWQTQSSLLPEGVYGADDGDFYSFDTIHVNCIDCLKRLMLK